MSGQVSSRSLKQMPQTVCLCLLTCKSLLIWWPLHQTTWRPSKGFLFYLAQLCVLDSLQSASAKCLGITSCPSSGVHSCVMWNDFTVASLSLWTGPSSVEDPPPPQKVSRGVVSLSPPSQVYPEPFGVQRSGGWASKGRARHPPLPRPRHQGRILTKDGFLNGPTISRGTSGDGLSSAMACFHITGKIRRNTVQHFWKRRHR